MISKIIKRKRMIRLFFFVSFFQCNLCVCTNKFDQKRGRDKNKVASLVISTTGFPTMNPETTKGNKSHFPYVFFFFFSFLFISFWWLIWTTRPLSFFVVIGFRDTSGTSHETVKPTFAQPTAQQIRKRKIKTTSKYKERLCCCFLGLFRYLLKPFLFNSFDVGDGRLTGALRAYLVASFALVPLKNKKKNKQKNKQRAISFLSCLFKAFGNSVGLQQR